jgi:hypothetical protein
MLASPKGRRVLDALRILKKLAKAWVHQIGVINPCAERKSRNLPWIMIIGRKIPTDQDRRHSKHLESPSAWLAPTVPETGELNHNQPIQRARRVVSLLRMHTGLVFPIRSNDVGPENPSKTQAPGFAPIRGQSCRKLARELEHGAVFAPWQEIGWRGR